SSCSFGLASARRSHSLGCASLEVAPTRASARPHGVPSGSRRPGAPTRSAAPRSKSRPPAPPLALIVFLRARVGAALPLARLRLARSRAHPRLRSPSSCSFGLASARRSHSLGCASLEVAPTRASARPHRVYALTVKVPPLG